MSSMTARRQALGLLGERIAARWLRRDGYAILAHRWRSGHRDLDLIVARDGCVAFVEVKTRRGNGFGGPVSAVGVRKQRELGRSARVWAARHAALAVAYRFDVFAVLVEGDGPAARVRVRHVPDAFPLPPLGG